MSDDEYEKEYVKQAFDTNWIAPLGENVDKFELELAEMVSANSAVALSSGTSAIHLSLKSSGVGEGDIVLCQSLTFSATANPILYQKATPVFIDSDYKTWNMCPIALEQAFKKYPRAKAVIIVHLYGFSADIDKIKSLCEQYKVTLIEDAAESLGSKYKGRYTGTFGEYGIYSFNGNKIITTSGGGMVVCNDSAKADKIKFWSTQSREQERHYEHLELGYNYRMSNVLAGIGRGQLKVLQQRVEKKKYIYEYYKRELSSLDGVEFMPVNDFDEPNYWLTCILLRGRVKALDIILELEKEDVEARPVWKPMHLQPVFSEYDYIGGNVSQDIFENGVCLPSDTKMSDEQLDKVCNIIKGLF